MKMLMILLFTMSMGSRAMDANCTVDPYAMSDGQTIGYTWFQIGAGAWAVALISSNFISSWFFYIKQEKFLAKTLDQHIKEIKKDIEIQEERLANYQEILNHIQQEHGANDEE